MALEHPDVLTDGVVELRRWRDSDVDAVQAAGQAAMPEALAWTERQQHRRSAVGVSCAVAPPGGRAYGYVGLIRRPRVEAGATRAASDHELIFQSHPDVAGIGYWTAPEAQGRGLATRAVTLLAHWGLRSAGLIRIEALVEPDNPASQRVVEKSGFQLEGHLRSYLKLDGAASDALVYALLAADL